MFCFARTKDNGITYPQVCFKKYIWTLCSLPAWSGNLCITFFLISFLMVLSKQKNKKRKVLQDCRSTIAGFIKDHELCTNWVQDFFSSSLVVYLAHKPPSEWLRLIAITCILCTWRPRTRVWIANTRVCMGAHAHPDIQLAMLPFSTEL